MVEAAGIVPAYCKVSAKIEPALLFEMRIPETWNGKLHYEGGGGFNGTILPVETVSGGPILTALQAGYITVTSDSGHQGAISDASWAIGNPLARRLFASESTPTVMASVLEMIESAYGKRPDHSYFDGCSNGGREALMNAQRHPELFDGIIARAPAFNIVGFIGAFQANARALSLPGGALTPAKVALLSNAVLEACDAKDGITDGLVSNPDACVFEPRRLRCESGSPERDTCLSDAQLDAIRTISGNVEVGGGAYENLGWRLNGNENSGWDAWITGPAPFQVTLMSTAIQSFFAEDLAVDALAYDLDADRERLDSVAELLDATDADLGRFRDAGGKLILWHGGADPALSDRNTEAYWQRVADAAGGRGEAAAFTRYYLTPGVQHCGGGPGPDTMNLLAALDAWVADGAAPGELTATKLDAEGSPVSALPLCMHPQYPRYTGPTDDADAAKVASNYTCTTP
jgi:feruloyl esterase